MYRQELTVCVTGAAGQIAYSFIPQLLKGAVFPDVHIHLRMLDITQALGTLKGVVMEIQDSTYPLLASVEYSDKPEEMFKDANVIVFLGGYPRKKGMERKDLLQMNKGIFQAQGQALAVASPDVKCVVIANPANTNAKILAHYSKTKAENITCLSRLDHNRAVSQIAQKTGAQLNEIEGVYVFGNHSLTQYPCIKNIRVKGKPIEEVVERDWLENSFIPNVQKRGGEILNVKGTSSVFSAANAVIDHLRDWFLGTDGRIVSMGVISKGDYGIPEGLWTSLPVTCKGFAYEVVKGIELSEFCQGKIKETVQELEDEVKDAELN